MPYQPEHKIKVRAKIIESARVLFNRHGFENVTIDMIMNHIGMTRGGFYHHFKSKENVYSEAVKSFLMGRGNRWRAEAGIDHSRLQPEMARQMIRSYLSAAHLNDLDGQCPMIALPSDVARANTDVQAAYQDLLEAMVSLFEQSQGSASETSRTKALAMAATCVGGMILARTLPDSALASEVQSAARQSAEAMLN